MYKTYNLNVMIKKKFPSKKYLNADLYYDDYISLKNLLLNQVDKKKLKNIIKLILKTAKNRNQVFTCGNGGSASTADHLTCDFTKGTSINTNLNIKSFSLNSNMSLVTAIANDISYDEIFSFQLTKYGNKNDVLLLFSVSGSSKNIIKCALAAKKKNIKVISFTGFDGGKIRRVSDYNLNFFSNNFGIVEDCHLTIMHYISQFIRMSHIKKNMNLSNINF